MLRVIARRNDEAIQVVSYNIWTASFLAVTQSDDKTAFALYGDNNV